MIQHDIHRNLLPKHHSSHGGKKYIHSTKHHTINHLLNQTEHIVLCVFVYAGVLTIDIHAFLK